MTQKDVKKAIEYICYLVDNKNLNELQDYLEDLETRKDELEDKRNALTEILNTVKIEILPSEIALTQIKKILRKYNYDV